MRKSLSMLLVLSFCFGLQRAARADETGFAYRPQLVASPSPALERAQTRKYVGIALFVLGTLATTASVLTSAIDWKDPACGYRFESTGRPCRTMNGGQIAAGVTLGVVGGAAYAIGLPMWVVGGKRERAIRKSMSVSASSLTLHF